MGGTRFNNRGIDETGAAANHVETEQIIIVGSRLYSFTQVRGSVPVFWKQKSASFQISLSRNIDFCFPCFSKHVDSLLDDYHNIVIINLLSNKKEGEYILTQTYESVVKKYIDETANGKKVKYAPYDIKDDTNNEVRI
jgi:hypothetical protein